MTQPDDRIIVLKHCTTAARLARVLGGVCLVVGLVLLFSEYLDNSWDYDTGRANIFWPLIELVVVLGMPGVAALVAARGIARRRLWGPILLLITTIIGGIAPTLHCLGTIVQAALNGSLNLKMLLLSITLLSLMIANAAWAVLAIAEMSRSKAARAGAIPSPEPLAA